MTTGPSANSLVSPAAAGLGNRGAPSDGRALTAGAPWTPLAASAVRAAALPRSGVSSSTPAAASCTAYPQTAHARGGGPPRRPSAMTVSAVQRSDRRAAATG